MTIMVTKLRMKDILHNKQINVREMDQTDCWKGLATPLILLSSKNKNTFHFCRTLYIQTITRVCKCKEHINSIYQNLALFSAGT